MLQARFLPGAWPPQRPSIFNTTDVHLSLLQMHRLLARFPHMLVHCSRTAVTQLLVPCADASGASSTRPAGVPAGPGYMRPQSQRKPVLRACTQTTRGMTRLLKQVQQCTDGAAVHRCAELVWLLQQMCLAAHQGPWRRVSPSAITPCPHSSQLQAWLALRLCDAYQERIHCQPEVSVGPSAVRSLRQASLAVQVPAQEGEAVGVDLAVAEGPRSVGPKGTLPRGRVRRRKRRSTMAPT